MARHAKDLFDNSTMSFGEHLEVLRVHVFKALIGLIISVILCLIYGEAIVAFVRAPIDDALADFSHDQAEKKLDVTDDVGDMNRDDWWGALWGSFRSHLPTWLGGTPPVETPKVSKAAEPLPQTAVPVQISAKELAAILRSLGIPVEEPTGKSADTPLKLTLTSRDFARFRVASERTLEPVTFNVQEAFMTYLKVSLIAAVVAASPWIFFQVWQFVAAGLYKHERRFVYLYGVMSLLLFLLGAAFCFYAVFPFVLEFLLEFNARIGVTPQIRLSEWISFAVTLPLMFGISFQLPLVMRFLSAINIFSAATYRAKRRMSILVIAFLSMILTPADPFSMLLMMIPLILLYELGIILCDYSRKNPFEGERA